MDGLTASIRKVGLVEPITVMPVDGGLYQKITAHRRFRAARDAHRSMNARRSLGRLKSAQCLPRAA